MARGIWYWRLLRVILAFALGLFSFIYVSLGNNEEGVRELIRWSARLSFVLFCLAFSSSALHNIFKKSWSWYLLMNRKILGIAFAIIHNAHLIFIIWLQLKFHPVFEQAATSSLIGGGIAYLFVFLMLISSFDVAKKRISSRQWKSLHTLGGYWIWAIFMTTYWKRADTEPVHWILIVVLLFVALVRISNLPGFIFKVRK